MSPRAYTPRAWWLNLDAELELQRPNGYHPSQRTRAFVEKHRRLAAKHLLTPDDVLVAPGVKPERSQGYEGTCWCPTPSALRGLKRAGCPVPPTPPLATLRAVNHRSFCARLGQQLPGAEYVTDARRLFQLIEQHPSMSRIVKRPFGFAGRGQRRLRGSLCPDDIRWLESAISQDGLQLEPLVEIEQELAIHGQLNTHGELKLGCISRQWVDEHRAWRASSTNIENCLPRGFIAELLSSAEATAEALSRAGYYGPFGIDAFVYRDPQTGAPRLNPRSELNARYTMGFGLGMTAAE